MTCFGVRDNDDVDVDDEAAVNLPTEVNALAYMAITTSTSKQLIRVFENIYSVHRNLLN
jgi:hypothetical protein